MTERTQGQQGVKDVAREETERMTERAREEAGRVAEEAKHEGQQLYEQARIRAREEARHQTDRAAEGLRTISSDLRTLAQDEETETPLAAWMQQGAQRLDDLAAQVGDRGFDGLMEDVKGYARRNPGTFLAISFGAGILAGRLARNIDMDGMGNDGRRTQQSATYTERGVERAQMPERGGPSLTQAGPRPTRPGGAQ